jgi:hypothetical protein
MGVILAHIIIITKCCSLFHTQTNTVINSLQKETIPVMGHGIKHLSILGKKTEDMNTQSMVVTILQEQPGSPQHIRYKYRFIFRAHTPVTSICN